MREIKEVPVFKLKDMFVCFTESLALVILLASTEFHWYTILLIFYVLSFFYINIFYEPKFNS